MACLIVVLNQCVLENQGTNSNFFLKMTCEGFFIIKIGLGPRECVLKIIDFRNSFFTKMLATDFTGNMN